MELDFKLVELGKSAPPELLARLPQGPEISFKAALHLKNFTTDQLQNLLISLDDAIETVLRIEHDLAPELHIERADERDLHWIHISSEHYNFDFYDDIPGVNNGHFFALYSLHQLGAAIFHIRELPKPQLIEASVISLVDAVEALSTARLMFERADRRAASSSNEDVWASWGGSKLTIEEQIQIAKSESGKKAASCRHQVTYRSQAMVIEMFQQRKYASLEAAAAHIAPHVHMTTRSVAKWLSHYKRDPIGFMEVLRGKLDQHI